MSVDAVIEFSVVKYIYLNNKCVYSKELVHNLQIKIYLWATLMHCIFCNLDPAMYL